VKPFYRTGLFVSTLIGGIGCIASTGCQPQAIQSQASQPAASEPSIASQAASPGKPPIRGRFRVAELPFDIVVFETVF